MNDLLTVRQVQEVLKVDRITVYRMTQDGRLNGVKIGKQWRFPESEIRNLLSGNTQAEPPADISGQAQFPTHCIQLVQDVVSDLSDISCLVIDFQGIPVTELSKPNPVCKMLLDTPEGRSACENCWQETSVEAAEGEKINTCHAGMTYLTHPIRDERRTVAFLLVGQFLAASDIRNGRIIDIPALAGRYNLNLGMLEQAVNSVPVYDDEKMKELQEWPKKISRVLEGILEERTILLGRLRRIAEISAV